jgi:hypothetical protein
MWLSRHVESNGKNILHNTEMGTEILARPPRNPGAATNNPGAEANCGYNPGAGAYNPGAVANNPGAGGKNHGAVPSLMTKKGH